MLVYKWQVFQIQLLRNQKYSQNNSRQQLESVFIVSSAPTPTLRLLQDLSQGLKNPHLSLL